jgi:hypothetical protein
MFAVVLYASDSVRRSRLVLNRFLVVNVLAVGRVPERQSASNSIGEDGQLFIGSGQSIGRTEVMAIAGAWFKIPHALLDRVKHRVRHGRGSCSSVKFADFRQQVSRWRQDATLRRI